ncbi:MAG: cyclase family protein [Candidatus Bathyarchaeia archaeon]
MQKEKITIIDLSYSIEGTMMVYPGLSRPVLEWLAIYDQEGFWSSKITIPVHVGTHIDAPKHFIRDGISVDQLALNRIVGEAVLCNVIDRQTNVITARDLEKFDNLIEPGVIVVINTEIHKKYGSYVFLKEHPYLSTDAAKWLVQKKIQALGVDMITVDRIGDTKAECHRIILGAGIPVVEGLTNLEKLWLQRFWFVALPLKIQNGEAAPCRVIAIIEKEGKNEACAG